MPKTYYYTQELIGKTFLFGKEYLWMKDVDGTIYLAHVDEEGQPVL